MFRLLPRTLKNKNDNKNSAPGAPSRHSLNFYMKSISQTLPADIPTWNIPLFSVCLEHKLQHSVCSPHTRLELITLAFSAFFLGIPTSSISGLFGTLPWGNSPVISVKPTPAAGSLGPNKWCSRQGSKKMG